MNFAKMSTSDHRYHDLENGHQYDHQYDDHDLVTNINQSSTAITNITSRNTKNTKRGDGG